MKEFLTGKHTYLLVFLVAFAQYSNTFKNDYAWDDAIVITENSRVQKGLSDVPELFKNIKSSKTEHKYGYRPITLLSFAAEVEFFGLDPTVGHVSNALYYAVLCALILFFLLQLFPGRTVEMLLVTLLFTVHPLHVEVVANIKSRDEILTMIFGLFAIVQINRFMKGAHFATIGLASVSMILAFLSKENAITFGGIAIILPIALSRKMDARHLIAAVAGIVITGLLGLVRMIVFSEGFFQDDGGDLVSKGLYHWDGFLGNPLYDVPDKLTVLANSIYLIPLYIKQFFTPSALVHDYGYNQLAVVSWQSPEVWLSSALVLALVVVMFIEWKKRSSIAFGLLWFFITISIYLHVVRVGTDMFADRFMFIPTLGLCLAVVGLVFRISKIKVWQSSAVFGLICLFFFTLSWKRNYAWKDNETLLTTDLPNLQNCARTNYNYALLLHGKYYSLPENEKARKQKEILDAYEKVLVITDRMFVVYIDLGGAYMEFGEYDKARETFELAIQKFPDISIPYVQMAKYYMTFKEYGFAVAYLQKAREIGQTNSDFYYLLAICKFNYGLHQEAITELITGETYGTSSSAYYDLMGRLYMKMGDKEKAIESLKRGIVKYPNDLGLKQSLEKVVQGN